VEAAMFSFRLFISHHAEDDRATPNCQPVTTAKPGQSTFISLIPPNFSAAAASRQALRAPQPMHKPELSTLIINGWHGFH
jgi:hypothetical protein